MLGNHTNDILIQRQWLSGRRSYSSKWSEDDEAELLQMADKYRVNGKPDFETIGKQMRRTKRSVTTKYNLLSKELSMDTNVNTLNLDPMQEKTVEQMNQYKMDGKTYWDNLEPFWNVIVSMAKDGEREDIKTTLTKKCKFIEDDSIVMAQWFIDNFKQKETIQEAPKGM